MRKWLKARLRGQYWDYWPFVKGTVCCDDRSVSKECPLSTGEGVKLIATRRQSQARRAQESAC
jgi:hypothetical protein